MANIVASDARTSIEREAREWLVRMDGDEPLTDVEKKALQEWMSRSASHREELERLSRFWNQANILTGLIGGPRNRHKRKRKKRAHV